MACRCLIVDDNPGFLEAAYDLLTRQGVNVVGVASTSAEALQRAEELRPELTLVDVELGDDSGFELARRLTRAMESEPPRVVLISTHAEQDFADLIAASPAVGFVSKSDLSRGAIRDVLVGAGVCGPTDLR